MLLLLHYSFDVIITAKRYCWYHYYCM